MPLPKVMTGLANKVKSAVPGSPRGSVDRDRDSSQSGSPARQSTEGKASRRSESRRRDKVDKDERRRREQSMVAERRRLEDEKALAEEDEETRARYGTNPNPRHLLTIEEVAKLAVGDEVEFRARIHTQRRISKMLDFVLFRDQTHSIQGVLSHTNPHMVRWVQRLHPESLVHVTGTLKAPVEPVRSATSHEVEVDIYSIHLVNPATSLPWDNYEPPESMRTRLSARVLDLRHPSNQALLRVRNMVTRKFRESLDDQGFIEIQTPKLQPAATESGSSVFKVNYFGRTAFLAQSPQLAKQMAISADLRRVYEIGPVFRAENSNTHRHLTEYTGLDIEMALDQTYEELIQTVDKTLKTIITAMQAMPELEVVRQRWPSTDLVLTEVTPIVPFTEGVQMLRDDGRDVSIEDLSTRDEIRLGELVKEKYKSDMFFLDKFPANARPFYAHRAEDPTFTNSFDILLRGQEICTGGQRIHDAAKLRESMRNAKITEDGMEEYLAAFDLGPPPHGGAGLGLERILMLFLELGDVRNASLFYRDPKSLPAKPPGLPHPEADTTKQWNTSEPPALEKLIANYGDASNTSWLDERFQLWRHPTGAAVGWVKQDKFCMIAGNPLCDPSQYADVAFAFIKYVERELHLTPIWMLVSEEMQQLLGNQKWRTLSCIEEQRLGVNHHIEPDRHDEARVEREGIEIGELRPDADFMQRADVSIEEWKAARKGKRQVHLTEIRPWIDADHRRYFAAQKDKKVLALVVLAQLAPRYGWQVKWALDFPSAPNGTIEVTIDRALAAINGVPATFGVGASEKFIRGAHLHGVRAKFLANTYDVLLKTLNLGKKSAFREKFGVVADAQYICYPQHGVSVHELTQIVKFFED